MNTLVIISLIILIFFVVPAGRKVLILVLGIIYLPLQQLFTYLQKKSAEYKEKDLILFYISSIFIYPLYAIIILYSKFFEWFNTTFHPH